VINSPAARRRPWLLPALWAVATLGAVCMAPLPAVLAQTIAWGYLALTGVVAVQAAAGPLPLQNRLAVVLVVGALGAFASWLAAPGGLAASAAVAGALAWVCAASLGRGIARWLLQNRRHRAGYGLEILALGAGLAAWLHGLLTASARLSTSPWPGALISASHLPAWLRLPTGALEASLMLVAAAPWFIDKRAHPAPPTPTPLLLCLGIGILAVALAARAGQYSVALVLPVLVVFLALLGLGIKPSGSGSQTEDWQPATNG